MPDWEPVALLPNISGGMPLDGGVIAIVPRGDVRVDEICKTTPRLADMLSRFTNAFGVSHSPSVLIVRSDVTTKLSSEAYMSFRDVAAISVIPYSRALNTVHNNSNRIAYANTFWIYPWTLNRTGDSIVLSTPALTAFHAVEVFKGQSSPELSIMEIRDLDEALFCALVKRWKQSYLGSRRIWRNRALFRSLNMAVQAASLPAGVGTTIFDLGRSVSLWVSAFEILSHPRTSQANLGTVTALLERVDYIEKACKVRRYSQFSGTRMRRAARAKVGRTAVARPRTILPCWVYGKLYEARNDFLHGNPIGKKALTPRSGSNGLFWLSPLLYRLALTAFLDLKIRRDLPYIFSDAANNAEVQRLWRAYDRQHYAERGLKRIRDL